MTIYYDKHYIDLFMNRALTLSKILDAVSLVSEIPIELLKSQSRKREIVSARYAYMLIADENTKESQTVLENFVNKQHASLHHARKISHLSDIKDIKELAERQLRL